LVVQPAPAALAVLMLLLPLAGCMQGAAPAPFDGDAALAFVRGLATQADGSPRYRMPGTPGQAEGASYLWNAMDVPGWSRNWQNFTGADYLALDRSQVARYNETSRWCPKQDLQALPSWPFHNLYAVRESRNSSAPLLLIGAHWDSQMHSDNDPNFTRRSWPDPGANDGASGVGVLLQLMRNLKGSDLPFSVGVFLTDGEDGFFDCYPIAGALYFVTHLPRPVSAFVLLDMVGDSQALFARETKSVRNAPALVDLVWRHGREVAPSHFLGSQAEIDDDHMAFQNAGIRAIDVIDAGHPTGPPSYGPFPTQWDTSFDTVDRLDANVLGAVGQVLLDSLHDAALPGVLAGAAA
jgi:hypothetical protein